MDDVFRCNNRRSIRLQNYDYSQEGMYFITICTYQKQCIFGEIFKGTMILNQIGNLVEREWLKSVSIREEIELDEWVVMPNHIHGIVIIHHNNNLNDEKKNITGAINEPKKRIRKPKSLSSFIAGFKASVTKEIKKLCRDEKPLVWQRNYYETVIRNEQQLNQIREYIRYNPLRWNNDPEKPSIQNSDCFIDFLF